MAEENGVPNNIVENILTRLDELSSRISPQETGEREVRRLFTGRRTSSSTSQASSSRLATGRQNSTYPNNRNFVRRHNFQGQRPSNVGRRKAKEPKVKAIDNRTFMRDLVLLDGPSTVVVPRQ